MNDMLDTSSLLIHEPNARVTVNKKILQEFVGTRINLKGKPVVICNGTVRLLKWKSLGAGFYTLYSEEM